MAGLLLLSLECRQERERKQDGGRGDRTVLAEVAAQREVALRQPCGRGRRASWAGGRRAEMLKQLIPLKTN